MFIKRKKRKKPFSYDYSDIAKATGYTAGTLRVMASKNKFNPYSLESVARLIAACILTKQRKVGPQTTSENNPATS